MQFTNRGEAFEAAFNVLDDALGERVAASGNARNGHLSFAEKVRLLKASDPVVRAYADDLLDYGELRNAIVHSRGRNGLRVIAEPVPEALAEFERIVQELTNPVSVISLSGGPPKHFHPNESLASALTHMRQHAFSQLVVKAGDEPLELLTETGIARWLEASDASALNGTTIANALRFEPPKSFTLVDRHASAHDVRERFQRLPKNAAEGRLQAVIVTEHGRASEKALGIITPWDLVKDGE